MPHELTKEQEAVIAAMAIDHQSISVDPQDDGSVIVRADGRESTIAPNGVSSRSEPESAALRLPVSLLRSMLGDERMDEALAEVRGKTYPDHGLGRLIDADVHAWCIKWLMEEART